MFLFPRRKSFLASFSLTGILLLLVAVNRNSFPSPTTVGRSSRKEVAVISSENDRGTIHQIKREGESNKIRTSDKSDRNEQINLNGQNFFNEREIAGGKESQNKVEKYNASENQYLSPIESIRNERFEDISQRPKEIQDSIEIQNTDSRKFIREKDSLSNLKTDEHLEHVQDILVGEQMHKNYQEIKPEIAEKDKVPENNKNDVKQDTQMQEGNKMAEAKSEVNSEARFNVQEVISNSDAREINLNSDAQEVNLNSDAQEVNLNSDAREVNSKSDTHEVNSNSDAQEVNSNSDTHEVNSNSDAQEVNLNSDTQKVNLNSDTQKVNSNSDAQEVNSNSDAQEVNSNSDTQEVNSNSDTQEVKPDGKIFSKVSSNGKDSDKGSNANNRADTPAEIDVNNAQKIDSYDIVQKLKIEDNSRSILSDKGTGGTNQEILNRIVVQEISNENIIDKEPAIKKIEGQTVTTDKDKARGQSENIVANRMLSKPSFISGKDKLIEKVYDREIKSKASLRKVKAVEEPLSTSQSNGTKSKPKLTKSNSKQMEMSNEYYKALFNHMLNTNKQHLQRLFNKTPKDIDFRPGEKLPVNKIRRVLIASTWRSGSTFLGDILQSYPATFYSFEPLHIGFRNVHLQNEANVSKALTLIRDIFSCNFSAHLEYMKYLQEYQYVIEHNKFLWSSCFANRALCFNPQFMTEICQLIPFNVMKVVRLGMVPIGALLEDKNLDIKVIHLVRDPRGSLHSRLKLKWCVSDICKDPKTVCNSLQNDLVLAAKYVKKYPDRFLLVRYEDLSLDPKNITKGIFEFLGLKYHDSIHRFLQDHTNLQDKKNKVQKVGTYTTFRDSQSIPFKWRNSLTYESVKYIQYNCKDTISSLGFRNFNTLEEYQNTNISVFVS